MNTNKLLTLFAIVTLITVSATSTYAAQSGSWMWPGDGTWYNATMSDNAEDTT